MTEFIQIGDQKIKYELIRKKVKNINLRIKPDLTITVSANPRVKKEYIETFLLDKWDWIQKSIKKLGEPQKRKRPDIKLEDAEVIRLLDREMVLHIILSGRDRSEEAGDQILLYVTDRENKERIRSLWNKWLEGYTRKAFYRVLEETLPKFRAYSIPMPILKCRSMKTRWGSCSVHTGVVTLNKALVFMPKECLEYVAAHEIAHFIFPDHSRNFYGVLGATMPDYKRRIQLMKEYGAFI